MSAIEIKKNFHNLIDSIDNENLLSSFYDILKSKANSQEYFLWNGLNYKERKELLKAFEESENSENLIDNDVMKKKHGKWL